MNAPVKAEGWSIAHGDARAFCRLVPWDSAAFGFLAGQIDSIDLGSGAETPALLASIRAWIRALDVQVVSCRLSHTRLAESSALESMGFRFIEFVLRPRFVIRPDTSTSDGLLRIRPAVEGDLDLLAEIAATAFGTGRYAMDRRLPWDANGRRYASWVRATPAHPSQRILVGEDETGVVGFFIVERLDGERMYWHLTAVAPRSQGRGLGKRLWTSILAHHAAEGVKVVETRISGHNHRVLNLYATLGVAFDPAEMTLHWVSPDIDKAILEPSS